MITPPKCFCSERSQEGRVFTCPECVGAALLGMEGHALDQHELFDEVDSTGSMRGLPRAEGQLTHVSSIVPVVLDGLPF